MTRRRGGAVRILLAAAAALVAVLVALLLLFPADAFKAQFEAKVSAATGYRVTTRSLGLGLAGFDLVLRVRDLEARSPDGSQTLTVPELGVEVALLPLFRKSIELRKLSGRNAVLSIAPADPAVSSPGGRDGAADSGGGAIAAPEIALTDSRIVLAGDTGVTRLEGVGLAASFRSADGGGRLDGRFHADSVLFEPRASTGVRSAAGAPPSEPGRPFALPRIDLAFGSDVTLSPLSATTRLEGTMGTWPLHGGVQTQAAADGVRNSGDLEFDSVSIDALRGFLPDDLDAVTRVYALGGTLTGGRLHFETAPGREKADYRFTARWADARASLPDKGPVVDDGSLDFELRPDDLAASGHFVLGASKLDLKARAEHFARPAWTADVRLQGPAADALRFLPPNADLAVSSGQLDCDVRLSGVAGRPGLPDMSGAVRVTAMTLTHAALPAPVDRLDLALHLSGTALAIESGFVEAAGSDARFRGTVADFRKPEMKLQVDAGTLDLGRLFPEAPKGSAARTGGSPPAPTGADTPKGAMIPASGTIAVDRLVRDRMTLTAVTARFAMGEAGVDLTQIAGRAYGGSATGELHLVPAGPDVWRYEGDFQVEEVKAAEFLAAVSPIRGIEGTLRTGFKVSGRNGPGLDPLASLTMTGDGIVFDGALANVPAVRKLASALNLKAGTAASIPFRTIHHRFRVEDGFVIMDTVNVAQASGDWTIGGRIGLDGRLDCPVSTRLSPELFTAGTDLRKLADLLAGPEGRLPVHLRLSGTLTAPEVSVDVAPLIEAARKKAGDSLGDELKKRLGGLLRKN